MLTYNIFLVGFMGTGKSTVAAGLSKMYHLKTVEMDEVIAQKEGISIPQIFSKYGEEYFRKLETECLRKLQTETNRVVSCGGGVILRDENISLMKSNGKVIWLTASPKEILNRVKNDDDRPLLAGKKNVEDITRLMEQRRAKYEQAADIVIHTDGKTVEAICMELMDKLENVKERKKDV